MEIFLLFMGEWGSTNSPSIAPGDSLNIVKESTKGAGVGDAAPNALDDYPMRHVFRAGTAPGLEFATPLGD
jgi:hypothetical protein